MGGNGTPDFNSDESPAERLTQAAEELMRQGRFQDAAMRYEELRQQSPTDPWVSLGHASALECAGEVGRAERVIEEVAIHHGRNAHVQRFRRMFFERREDIGRAQEARASLRSVLELREEPPDQLADLYFNQGRYHDALTELRRVVNEEHIDDSGNRASVEARIGACLRQAGQLEDARDHLLHALALDQGNHWTLAELAEAERALGNADAARERYLQALEAEPDDHWCRGHLAQLEHEQGNSERAIALYEEILHTKPKATWAMVELAQVLTDRDPERSRALCQHALQEDPAYPWGYAQLGHLDRLQGRLDSARKHFQEALQASPNTAWILHELADTCRHMGRIEEALTHLEHARNQNPFDATTYGYMADVLRGAGRTAEARAHLHKAVEFDPDYAWAWRELAELEAVDQRPKEAEAAYREAARIEPDDPINDGLMAFILRNRDEREAALPYLRSAVARQTDYAWAWRELVEQLLALGRHAEAAKEAKRALDSLPDHGPMQVLLAEALRRQGAVEESLTVVAEALEREPESAQLWALQAEMTLQKDAAKALRFARRAARLDGGTDFQVLLAQVLLANDRADEAQALVHKVTRQHPSNSTAWLMLSDLLERSGEARQAEATARTGIEQAGDDPRLELRLARLEHHRGIGPGLDRIEKLIESHSPLPIRETAQLLAEGGRAVPCRRMLARLIDETADERSEQASAWLLWAECEVALGQTDAAAVCAAKALDADPRSGPARAMAAALAEGRGDLKQAIEHLETLRHDLASQLIDSGDTEGVALLRQLALLYERVGRDQDATSTWSEISTHPLDDETRSEKLRWHLRRDEIDAAEALARDSLADRSPAQMAQPGSQRLLRELTLAAFQSKGSDGARAVLAEHDDELDIGNRELHAQLLLGGGQAADAIAQLDAIDLEQVDDIGKRRLALLRIRALLAQGSNTKAEGLARDLVAADESDEDAAVLLAEALAYGKRCPEALASLQNSNLSGPIGSERALLGACLLLELQGPDQAITWLSRSNAARESAGRGVPLARLLAAAWPQTWTGTDSVPAAEADDITCMPPLPRCAANFAAALETAGQRGLAARMLALMAAASAQRDQPLSSRELYRQLAPLLRRMGLRRQAFSAAWSGRSISAWLRCLLPF